MSMKRIEIKRERKENPKHYSSEQNVETRYEAARARAIHTQTDMIYTIELLIYGLIVKCNNFPIYTDIVFEWKKKRTQRQTAKLSVCVSFFSGFVRRLLHTMLPCRCFNLINKFSSLPLFLASCFFVAFSLLCFSCNFVDDGWVRQRMSPLSSSALSVTSLAHGGFSSSTQWDHNAATTTQNGWQLANRKMININYRGSE